VEDCHGTLCGGNSPSPTWVLAQGPLWNGPSVWNPRHTARLVGGHGRNDRKRHYRDPKGLGLKASASGMRDAQEQLPFRAPNIIFRYTTEELPSLAAQYTTSKGAATPLHVAGDREAALAVAKWHHPTSLPKMPRRMPRAARR
jgi:hypothetical protein